MRRCAKSIVVVALLACALLAPAAQAATRALIGQVSANPPGAGAGQLNVPRGPAVNRTGAGGVAPGDFYVADSVNNRVSEFSAAGAFVRAFGFDVVAPGSPDGSHINEQQELSLDPKATGGTFTLSFGSLAPTTTTPISATATALEVETALAALGSIGGVANIDVTNPSAGHWVVEFVGALADRNVGSISFPSAGKALSVAVGTQLECSSSTSATTTNFQWLRNGTPITGATGATYTTSASSTTTPATTTGDAGATIQCQVFKFNPVSVNNTQGTGSTQASNPPTIVSPYPGANPPAAPSTVASPTLLSGALTVGGAGGAVLKCEPGAWTGALSFSYQWYRNGVALSGNGANTREYTVQTADLAARAVFQCAVTATNAGGSVVKVSQNKATATAPLPFAPGNNTGSPSVSVPPLTTTTATTTEGSAAPEICSAGVDVCQAGPEFQDAAGAIVEPLSVAIDPSHGNVYVYDPSFNHRVDVFSATGAFQGAFGQAVKKTTPLPELQFCTTATGCQEGETGESAGAFRAAGPNTRTMAVDSSGNLYVANSNNQRLDEFSPTFTAGVLTGVSFLRGIGWDVIPAGGAGDTGAGLEACTVASTCQEGAAGNGAGQFLAGSLSSIAVDSAGSIYAVNGNRDTGCSLTETCRVEKFNPDGTLDSDEFGPASGQCQLSSTSGTLGSGGTVAVAVDPTNQDLFALKRIAGAEMKVCELDSAGGEVSFFPSATLPVTGTYGPVGGLAVGTGERVYATDGELALNILGPIPSPGVEIDAATEVTPTTAKLNGEVTVPAPGGPGFEPSYRFEYSADNGLNWTSAPVPDAGLGTSTAGTYPVSLTVTELQPGITYRFRLVATTGASTTSTDATFTTLAAKPSVSKTIALPVTGTSAKLNAVVNPNNSPTTYHFEWGPCATPGTCSTSPYGNQAPDFDPFAGAGGQALPVSAKISGLQLSTTYHFRLLATNASGTTFGPDATFTTSAFEGINEAGLPDNRGIELVSPPDKRPQGAVEGFVLDAFEVNFQAAAGGGSVLFPILSGLGDTAAGGSVHYLAARSGSGWQSARVSPDSTVPNPAWGSNAIPSELVYATPDLACQRVETFNPVTADTPPADVELGVTNLYLRKTDGSYALISNAVPANPTLSRIGINYYTVGGASPDCGRLVFQTPYQLLPGNPSGLYEWDHGTLRDAGLRPDGSAAPDTGIGALTGHGGFYRDDSAVNAVAPDGSRLRLFFNATSNEGGDNGKAAVFVRKGPDLGETVDASQKQAGGTAENNGAYYQTASPDGKHLFFTANYGLTGAPGAGWPTTCNFGTSHTQGLHGEGCDLYDYDVEEEELTDLSATADPANTNGAEVQGVVAVSEKGDYLYFAARGQLVPGQGNTYAQNHSGAGFTNIYLSHDGALAFVATIRFADLSQRNLAFDGTDSGNLMVQADSRTSQTTPDGRRLLFTSKANVTGYPAGEVSQAYLYSADSGATVCVSCRPGGQPSVGNFYTTPIRASITEPEEHYRIPRSLSADGNRVFFSMPDALAPGALESPWGSVTNTSGKTNLYEWEQGQVYFLATFENKTEGFVDASASGDDVFLQSPDRLDPRYDVDTVRDLYDFRVNGGFPDPPPPPPVCNVASSECQGTAEPTLAPLVPRGSAIATGGNPPLQQSKCSKGKVRRNGKCLKKHHKRHAKRAGRNRAANTHNGGAK